MTNSLPEKYLTELDKLKELCSSLSSEMLKAYVTQDPLYKSGVTGVDKNEIKREVSVTPSFDPLPK